MDKRQQLVDLVRARLALILDGHTITLPSGAQHEFQTNLGERVTEWGVGFDETELPLLNVRDTELSTAAPETERSGSRRRTLRVQIEIQELEESAAPVKLRQGIADVLAAVGSDSTWSGHADRTERVREAILTDEQGSYIAAALVEFEIRFFASVWG
jgi:hypothetical protein